ncbi:MAG: HNH endonuclease [Candidatus Aenigmarchaeota archaeon]|nr:HNH endonuclease [Candidatus Aenigmarchaeota archaeon]
MAKTYKNKSGYRKYKDSGKFVHIANAEKKIGGKIFKGYEVHHKDLNKDNNRISNLAVLKKDFHQKVVHKKKKSNWF